MAWVERAPVRDAGRDHDLAERSAADPGLDDGRRRRDDLEARLILRERLVEPLTGARARAVVMTAPGGYGKSALLAQWSVRCPLPVVWVTVSETAPDAVDVMRRVVQGLDDAGLVREPVVLPSQTDEASWPAALKPFGRAVAGADRDFLLVIDDADKVSGFAWEQLLQVILASLPGRSMLAVATRGSCPTPLRRLRVTGDLLELGIDDLAMDETEIEQVLAAHAIALPLGLIDDVKGSTEGWPAAVYLFARATSAGRVDSTHEVRLPAAIDDFIRDEVMTPLSTDDAHLLLRCSVLEDLVGPLCDAVSGRPHAINRLAELARSNHLIIPVDDHGEGYRLHQLLADFLRREFRHTDPAGLAAAHAAASRECERVGDADAAVFHARLAADDERLGELVLEYSARLLTNGGAPVLARWLDGLEPWRIEQSIELALVSAWVASQQGDVTRCQALSLSLQQRCRESDVPSRLCDLVLLLRATLGFEGIDQMLIDTTGACQRMEPDDPWLSLAHYLRGCALAMGARFPEAREALVTAGRLASVHELPLLHAHILSGLVDVALATQDMDLWAASVERIRVLMAVTRMDDITTAAPIIASSAEGYLIEGRLIEAVEEATRARRLCAQMFPTSPWAGIQVRVKLARVFLATGAPDVSRQLLREALDMHDSTTRCPMIDAAMVEAEETLIASEHEAGSIDALSTAELRVLQYLPTHLTFPEIGQRLFISKNTVKTQAISIYRKLGVHSRAEAVDVARGQGLLP